MNTDLKKDGGFQYLEVGEGTPIVILHGLMGNLSNFEGVLDFFPPKGYKVLMPALPIYDLPLIKTNVKNLAKFVKEFIEYKELKDYLLMGNSLGGHISLYFAKLYPKELKGMILTGSSGLYENAMGGSFPRRGDYDYVTKKIQDVFYDDAIATKEIIDESFATINDRSKLIRILALAKSAIRHNMSKDLPDLNMPVCLIWGKNDVVTPPNVADEFNELLPNSDLYWIDKCGHTPMMEHPDKFNEIIEEWFKKTNI
ncbi:MAG: alpha/beta hydrolase [Flavobacteriaceae bacterium]